MKICEFIEEMRGDNTQHDREARNETMINEGCNSDSDSNSY